MLYVDRRTTEELASCLDADVVQRSEMKSCLHVSSPVGDSGWTGERDAKSIAVAYL